MDWQYSGKEGNPFVDAMMSEGNSTKGVGEAGPRMAFYAGDERARAAGFPTDHFASFTNPMTGKHLSWIPDANVSRRDGNVTSGVFGDLYDHPNLEKVYPELMNTPVREGAGLNAAGAVFADGSMGFNDYSLPVMAHEIQHKINNTDKLVRPQEHGRDQGMWNNLVNMFTGNQRYYNSDDEAVARSAQDAMENEGFHPELDRDKLGVEGLRNDMVQLSGSRKFWGEE